MNIQSKFCHNCGQKVQIGAKFCHLCGTSLSSLSEKPPVFQNEPPPKNQNRQNSTFKPMASNDGEFDDDDGDLRVDRINSIRDLNLGVASLDVDFRSGPNIRETVGGLMNQGAAIGQNYKEPPRGGVGIEGDQKAFLDQFKQEGGTLRNHNE